MALPEIPTVLMDKQDADFILDWQISTLNGTSIHRPSSALKLLEEVIELCFAAGATTEEVRIIWEQGERKAIDQQKAFGHYFSEDVREEIGDVAATFGVFCWTANVQPAAAVNQTVKKIQSRSWYPDEFGILRRSK